jgi:hypothetical protein
MAGGRLARYALALRATAAVTLIVVLKLGAHVMEWEFLTINPLFSGIVAANVFLMGFLLSGVLSDFKESERIPGEIAASLEVFVDEAATIHRKARNAAAADLLDQVKRLAADIHAWFHRRERSVALMERVADLGITLAALEPFTQPNYIVRLKQEQHALRRLIVRAHTIRDTSFVSSGYMIAELTTALLSVGLVFARIDPFYESLFVVGVIIFMLSYLILLIRDLDNPFGYADKGSSEDVSLRPLEDLLARLAAQHPSQPSR